MQQASPGVKAAGGEQLDAASLQAPWLLRTDTCLVVYLGVGGEVAFLLLVCVCVNCMCVCVSFGVMFVEFMVWLFVCPSVCSVCPTVHLFVCLSLLWRADFIGRMYTEYQRKPM